MGLGGSCCCRGDRGLLVGVPSLKIEGDFDDWVRMLPSVEANWNFLVGVKALPIVLGEDSALAGNVIVGFGFYSKRMGKKRI